MKFYRCVMLLVFCKVLYATGMFNMQCRRSSNCFCTLTMHTREFQCPNEKSPKVIIKVQPKVVNIQCVDTLNWKSQDLASIERQNVNHIVVHNCWLPGNKFVGVMKILEINSTKVSTLDISVDFTNITLTSDYFEGLPNLKKIILHDSDVKHLGEGVFKSLDNLIELSLRNNNIHLFDDLFRYSRNLSFLELVNNNLSFLPFQLFQSLTELKTLHLWSNKFITLNSSTFVNLRNLQQLELSRNQLQNLPDNVFYDLENLKTISLSMNKLQSIPENLFTKNALLEFVNISKNPNLTYVPNNVFANLTNLGTILLNDCKLSYLPTNLFDGLWRLKNVSLQENEITHIPETIFKDLAELQNLDLSYNKIRDLSNEVFASLYQLETLNLESNLLTNIKQELFQTLQRLEELNLKNNRINFIDIYSFRRIGSLKKIILANNYLNLPMGKILNHNINLEKIDLSHNNITAIDDFFAIKVGLRELDLSYNQISYLKFSNLLTVSFPIKINLKHNNISTINFDYAETIARSQGYYQHPSVGLDREVYLDGNPINCDCYLYNFTRYFDGSIDPTVPNLVKIVLDNLTCTSPNDFINLPVKKLTPSMLICPLQQLGIKAECPEKCLCAYRPYDQSLIINCKEANLTDVPKLGLKNWFNPVEVYLQRNMLTLGPAENMGYENVTKLFLSYNSIKEVTWIPPNIKILQLNNNNIQHLNEEVVTMLNTSSLTNITLGDNPFNCDCSVENLRTYVISHLLTKKVYIDINNITCKNGKQFLDVANDYCPPYKDILIGFTIALILVIVGIAILLIFWMRRKKDSTLLKNKLPTAKN